MNRRDAVFLLSALATASTSWAQGLSGRPVRLVVPWSPGGGADISARILAPKLGQALDTQVMVDNRPGGTGTIGTDFVAKSAPDGHTLILGTNSTYVIAVALFDKLPYDHTKDLTPITRVAAVPHVVAVHPSVQASTVAELVALAKSKPDLLSFGSSGAGSTPHVAGEQFKLATGTKFLHVPYKGSGQSLADTLAGNVLVSFDTLPSLMGHLKSGRLRPLAVLGPKRVSSLPELPTIAEAGVPGVEGVTWFGLYGPGGMPPALVSQLHAQIVKIMAQPDIEARFREFGAEDLASASPAEFSQMVTREIDLYSKVIKQAGIKKQE